MDHCLVSTLLVLLLGLTQASPLDWKTADDDHYEESNSDISTRIIEANKEISHLLMEGDVAVPTTRNAMKCWQAENCKWQKSSSGLVEVPYTVSSYFYDNEKAMIEKAMETFHMKTCVRFIPYSGQLHYLNIESKTGCWSYLGRTGGEQPVSLSVVTCLHHGVIQHELLHALGFNHEQNRSDRDQYVRINWEYIHKASASVFKKRDTNNLNTPYDYSSIMHYGRTVLSMEPGKETITPIPDSSVLIGQREEMSNIDIQRINKLYECSE